MSLPYLHEKLPWLLCNLKHSHLIAQTLFFVSQSDSLREVLVDEVAYPLKKSLNFPGKRG